MFKFTQGKRKWKKLQERDTRSNSSKRRCDWSRQAKALRRRPVRWEWSTRHFTTGPKAQRQGKLEGADSKVKVSAEQMVIIRWASAVQRRHLSDVALLVHIKAIHAETRGGYGWPST